MESFAIQGRIDDQHRLSAVVPESIPSGIVTVFVSTVQDDEAGAAWMAGIANQWADDLSDPRQDIYSFADGEAIDPAK